MVGWLPGERGGPIAHDDQNIQEGWAYVEGGSKRVFTVKLMSVE